MRSVAFALALVTVPSVAMAHFRLEEPVANLSQTVMNGDPQKMAPCGQDGTATIAGSKLMVKWDETVEHPGHYRIAFDDDGQDFPDPVSFNGNTEGMPTVVKDLIPDVTGLHNGAVVSAANPRPYQFEITLPDIACTNCTLQVIQMMTETTTFEAANDIYYQCADITLVKAGAPDAGVTPTPDADPGEGGGNNNGGGGEISGGCSTGNATGFLALLGLLGLRRRRRS